MYVCMKMAHTCSILFKSISKSKQSKEELKKIEIFLIIECSMIIKVSKQSISYAHVFFLNSRVS